MTTISDDYFRQQCVLILFYDFTKVMTLISGIGKTQETGIKRRQKKKNIERGDEKDVERRKKARRFEKPVDERE